MTRIVLLLCLLVLTAPAFADDLDARAKNINQKLRCLVCQNESIDTSQADLAADLRQVVRERLEAGDSDEAVITYIHDRYGDFVLMRPPVKPATLLLWAGPAFIFLGGGFLLWRFHKKSQTQKKKPLTGAERALLRKILKEERR